MAGFSKARGLQAALKVGIYGPPGSGKTFTALLLGEGLAKASGKRIAYVDTERGTDFYAQHVPERQLHPQPFDFDALYSRSLTEVLRECQKLSPADYGTVVIDSITHLWEAAIGAYSGKTTTAGTIPMHAWGAIKKPYKALIHWALNSPLHVFILGRQGNEYADDDEGEMKNVGYKMKAEGETAYEPHLLIRLEACKPPPRRGKRPDAHALTVPTAFVEKDRSGVLFGKLIEWPNFENLVAPLLPLLGQTQAQTASAEEAASDDADVLGQQERDRRGQSKKLLEQYKAQFALALSAPAVEAVARAITPAIKRDLLTEDVDALRAACQSARQRVGMQRAAAPEDKGARQSVASGPPLDELRRAVQRALAERSFSVQENMEAAQSVGARGIDSLSQEQARLLLERLTAPAPVEREPGAEG